MKGSSEGEVSIDLIEISERSSGGLTCNSSSRRRRRLDRRVQRASYQFLLLFIRMIRIGVLDLFACVVVVVAVGVGFGSTARAQLAVVVLHGNREVGSAKELKEIEFQTGRERERDRITEYFKNRRYYLQRDANIR